MKTPVRFLQVILIFLAIAGFYSCEKSREAGKGTAEFSLSLPGIAGELKSANVIDSGNYTFQLLISVEDLSGNPVFTDKLIPIYAFGAGFVSEKIEIETGEYNLTKFMVIDPSGNVLYASPLAGSPLAYLIERPLPFSFTILAGRVTQVTPEVLAVEDNPPEKFGYASFGVHIVTPLTFFAGAVIDNPMIMAPFPQFTEARLTVFAKDGWHFTFKLFAGVNKLIIRGGSDMYHLILEKEGYQPQKFEFTDEELKAATREKPLYLKIPWDSYEWKTLILQPGPDKGKDAMISNLNPDMNFGNHKFFEATFLSEPILTVMRSNRSLIWFDLSQVPENAVIKKVMLTLSYQVPLPWDSTIYHNGTADNYFGAVLQQVIEPWDEATVTWDKEPASIEANQVLITPFIRNVNFIQVDVTRLIFPVTANPLPNYGMKFRLWPDNSWPGMRFASSDHPDASLRPKLTVYYVN